jgi:hypothetical protein
MLLFKCDIGGHFSKSGRFDRMRETAFEYAFLLKAWGLTDKRPLTDPLKARAAAEVGAAAAAERRSGSGAAEISRPRV